jgi:ABC-type sugar transport system ATPase subunit
MMAGPPMISVRNLAKRYGGVVALQDMSLTVERGTIHAVVGENGAGKSTLMKVLAGVVRPDGGVIELDGQSLTIDSPHAARRHGIGMVYQELSLFPERSVLANLFVNREPVRRGLISNREMEARSHDLLRQLGLHVDVHAPVSRLSIGERQLVELARVLLEHPRLLILDEPNSALNQRETERLFTVLKGLRANGITMLYVSHRLEEVFAISDRVTITRNGRDVLTRDCAALTIPEVIEGMIGQQREALFPPALPMTAATTEARMVVKGLAGGKLADASFDAGSGEVIGLAGLEGSGVSDLLEILFGMRRARGGEVRFPDGKGVPKSSTEAARRNVCLVPADRRRNGLMLDKSILFNISNVIIGARGSGSPWYSPKTALGRANRQINALRIKGLPHALANSLSGGNQQKVVIGKWLEIGPRVFLLDDPTRGVDIGAKREIYTLIREMSANGGIVLFSSTELPELIGLCDRILVIYQGRLAGEVSGAEMSSQTVLHLTNTGEMPGADRKTPARQGDMA